MAKPKLVSLNMGMAIVVQKDGQNEKISFSLSCPSKSIKAPLDALQAMCDFVNDEFGTHYSVNGIQGTGVKMAKVEIKATVDSISQEEFNKKIKEIVP